MADLWICGRLHCRNLAVLLLVALAAVGVCRGQEIRVAGGVVRVSAKGEVQLWVAGVEGAPPVLGSSRVEGTETVFAPRFGLAAGVKYRVVFRGSGGVVEKLVDGPARELKPAARVESVYPSGAVVPENLLKFYVHFSGPMTRREAYRRVRLEEAGKGVVELPFLELEPELWDRDTKRLTLLFDPGRVKRDLKPHREAGTPLEAGRRYTLVVERGWKDAEGRELAEDFRKPFRVGPADRVPVDPQKWKIQAPRVGTREAVEVEFGEALDRALLERVVWVASGRGERLEGRVEVDREESRWRFWPGEVWEAGGYWLRVEKILEDLAGNTVGKAFEVDVFEKVEERVAREMVSVGFSVK